jgi:Zn-dependent metalloprotease
MLMHLELRHPRNINFIKGGNVKRLIIITLLIIAIEVTANSQTADQPNIISPNGYIFNPTGAIAEEFGEGNVTGIRYAENGTVKTINGKLDKGLAAIEPLAKCYEFFELHKHLYGLDNPREELVFYSIGMDSLSFKFRQFYNGIQIGFHRIIVSFDKDHSIIGVSGSFVNQIKSLNSTPAISEEEAIQIATNDYMAQKHKAEPKSGKTELKYLKDDDGSYYLAWEIYIGYRGYRIDAMTGNIKKSYSSGRF